MSDEPEDDDVELEHYWRIVRSGDEGDVPTKMNVGEALERINRLMASYRHIKFGRKCQASAFEFLQRTDHDSGRTGWSLLIHDLPDDLTSNNEDWMRNIGVNKWAVEAYGPVEVVVEKAFNIIFEQLKVRVRRQEEHALRLEKEARESARKVRELEKLRRDMGFYNSRPTDQLPLIVDEEDPFPVEIKVIELDKEAGVYSCAEDGSSDPIGMMQEITMFTTKEGLKIGNEVKVYEKRHVILELAKVPLTLRTQNRVRFRVREV